MAELVAHLLAKTALEKFFEIMTKTKKIEVLYYNPKVAYPERHYGKKIMKIHEIRK
jgi:hypothetical protein